MEIFKNYLKLTVLLISFLFLLSSLYIYLTFADRKIMSVSFLDVGQGDAIYIETPNRRKILIDGGPSEKIIEKLGKKISFFDNSIDLLVATHPDADHITGLIPVLAKYEVEKLVISPAKAKTGIFDSFNEEVLSLSKENIHIGNLGDEINLGEDITVQILSPRSETWRGEETNSFSVVVLLNYGQHSFLLTGDLPEKGENEIVRKSLGKRNITVLKAGHHGSNTSSGNLFLNYFKPFYSVISAGKDNRYGHPHSNVIDRLSKNTESILSTIVQGTITFYTDGSNLRIETDK